ncbi:MAG: cold-shock protein, partial [Gluconobacter japonicus]
MRNNRTDRSFNSPRRGGFDGDYSSQPSYGDRGGFGGGGGGFGAPRRGGAGRSFVTASGPEITSRGKVVNTEQGFGFVG